MYTSDIKPGFHPLLHSTHLIEERLRDLLKPLGIHGGQARCLHALDHMGEASQRMLAAEFNVSAASMSEMTKRLINNGFIEIRDNPDDKRASILSLSEKGHDLLQQVYDIWMEIDQIIINAIGGERAEQLFADSFALRNALGGKAPGRKIPD